MSITVDEILSKEKLRIFTIDLSKEELEQISLCRNGILGASGLGAIFGLFCGKIALGPTPSSTLLKSSIFGGKLPLISF